jgi:hypothetical protein
LALGLLLGLGLLAGARLVESAGAAREPELQERLSELQWALALRDAELRERERVEPGPGRAAVEEAERRLAAREADIERREHELAERGRAEAQRQPASPTVDPEVAQRLERRAALVTARERELARRVGGVAARERELEEEAAALAERLADLERREAALDDRAAREDGPTAAAAPAPEPAADGRAGAASSTGASDDDEPGRWNLEALSRLVGERGDEFPDRLDEWNSYLFFLRQHADAAGRLPRSFDWLVEDTFRELVS